MLVRVSVERVIVDSADGRYIVVLKDEAKNRWLPIVVGQPEAQAIALQMEKIAPPRPLTHDLLWRLVDLANLKVERIVVSDLRDNTYYALLSVRLSNDTREVDARPSDAIALALRAQAPIFVEEEVMRVAAVSESDYEEKEATADETVENSISLVDTLEKLRTDLHKAVTEERYEEAARIRDQIARLTEEFRHHA